MATFADMQRLACLALLVALFSTGCRTPGPRQSIRFESEPPGVRVFVGTGFNESNAVPKNFIGSTPCEFEPRQDKHGRFLIDGLFGYSKFVAPAIVFEARHTNGSSRRVVYRGEAFKRDADRIPAGIFFDFSAK